MTPKIILYTVPHTGTHFVMKLFEELHLEKSNHWFRYHSPRNGPKYDLAASHNNAMIRAISAKKLIVTARDPYLSAIRWISPGENRHVATMAYSWKNFFDVIDDKEHFVVDIGCREEDRVQHLCDAADYMEVEYDLHVIEQFAKEWKPENGSKTSAKTAYIQNKELPDPGNDSWDMLDEAVAWYKNLPTNNF